MTFKYCSHCMRHKPYDEFHADESRADGLNRYCKVCVSRKRADDYEHKAGRYLVPDEHMNHERIRRINKYGIELVEVLETRFYSEDELPEVERVRASMEIFD